MLSVRDHSARQATKKPPDGRRNTQPAAPPYSSTLFLQRCLGNHLFQQVVPENTIQRKCACGGTCAHCSGHDDEAHVQTKLTVGAPDDHYEREADRVADQVMRMPETQIQRQTTIEEEEETIQTKPLSAQITPLVQRKTSPNQVTTAPHGMHETMRSPGRPLSAATRSFMEPRFGIDFSSVRLHTGPNAEKASGQVHARAFTYGKDIWLGQGATESDRRLLAHELTHVVQQGGNHLSGKVQAFPLIQRLPFGISLPSGVRPLDPTEEAIGRGVYGGSLDYGDIYISDALGGGGRPFTLYLPFVGTVIQMGPGPYATPGSNPGLLIHEMAHSWQSQHHVDPAAYMANSIASQALASASGGSAYCYIPGKPFNQYAAEQLAEQAEDGVTAIRSHMNSVASGAIDPDLNLLVPRWEMPGSPGVRC